MSLEGRQKAVEMITSVLLSAYDWKADLEYNKRIASCIMNHLLGGGYLNDNATVYVHEVEEEFKQVVFKCKVEE